MKTARERFAYCLKNIRKNKEMNQEDLALKCDVSKTTVTNWETGKMFPSANNIDVICKALECKPMLMVLQKLTLVQPMQMVCTMAALQEQPMLSLLVLKIFGGIFSISLMVFTVIPTEIFLLLLITSTILAAVTQVEDRGQLLILVTI